MDVAVGRAWTRDEFLDWAEAQDGGYEFDGLEPVAMNGGTVNHDVIGHNIVASLRQSLRGSGCMALGPTVGVATVRGAIRYPDALVTCTPHDGQARIVPEPVVVFEVLSPSSGRVDRVLKLREYAGVASILRYVIVESTWVGLEVLSRAAGEASWTVAALEAGDVLAMPEIGAELPVAEIYADVAWAAPG